MIPATLALRQTLVAALREDAGVAELVAGRVYDHVPSREVFPYIQIRTDQSRAWDTSNDRGAEIMVEINVWSRQEGRRECEIVLQAVLDALQDRSLTLTDHRLVNLEWSSSRVIPEEGGQTYFGFASWRAATEEI